MITITIIIIIYKIIYILLPSPTFCPLKNLGVHSGGSGNLPTIPATPRPKASAT